MQSPEPILLVCAPATIPIVARGTVFKHRCSRCHDNVALGPCGQRFIKEHPDAAMVCCRCVTKEDLAGQEYQIQNIPDPRLIATEPNTWRDRN